MQISLNLLHKRTCATAEEGLVSGSWHLSFLGQISELYNYLSISAGLKKGFSFVL